ncbi:MAG: hypothetical protein GY765_19580 [bacterium]|nr:hypothetical protein [bacterium]
MSSLRSDPYVAVFLTKDSYKDVIEFYKKSLKKGEFIYKELPYGARGKTVLTVYQFEMEKGILTNQISKGIEIVPYNTWNSRVYKANTKIKIILPAAEVKSAQKKMRQGNSGQRDEV